MNEIEIGKDNRIIEWREHALSGVMRSMREKELILDPVLHPAGSFKDRQLIGVKPGAEEVTWQWGNWSVVIAAPFSQGQSCGQRRLSPGEYFSWEAVLFADNPRKKSFYDQLELTPLDGDEQRGATVRVERPAPDGPVVAFEPGPAEFGVSVRLKLLDGNFDPRRVKAQRLQFSGDDWSLDGEELPFNQEGWVDAPAGKFRGAIAVVEVTEGNGRRLLACQYFNSKTRALDKISSEETIAEIRSKIEGRTSEPRAGELTTLQDWLGQWPHRSSERLHKLYWKAISPGSTALAAQLTEQAAVELCKENPTGLQRGVVLRLCGFQSQGVKLDHLAERLKNGDFLEAMCQLMPKLPPNLAEFRPAVQQWMIRHTELEDFEKAVNWAGADDEKSLGLALQLIKTHEQANDLLRLLQPSAAEYDECQALLLEIWQAPRSGGRPDELKRRVETLKNRIERDLRQPVDADREEPPITRERHAEWKLKADKTVQWRKGLAQVLAFCENGDWQSPDDAPSPEELTRRLLALKTPKWSSSRDLNDPFDGAVAARIEDLLAEPPEEEREQLRELACERLENAIKPHAAVWGALHAVIREAKERIDAKPALHAFLVSSVFNPAAHDGLSARAAAAERFLEIAEAAEKELQSWRPSRLTELPNDRESLRLILHQPDHPRIPASFARGLALYEFLDTPRYRNGIEKPALPAPPENNPAGFRAWWQRLRELDYNLDHLDRNREHFEDQVRSMRERTIPAVESHLERHVGKPPRERPGYYNRLEELYHCWRREDADRKITPTTLNALLQLLADQRDWRRD